jgi:hypothetical protein
MQNYRQFLFCVDNMLNGEGVNAYTLENMCPDLSYYPV